MSTFDKPACILTHSNFGRWKVMVKALLEAKEVADVVAGTYVKPAEDASAQDKKAWSKSDAVARVILISSLDDEHEKFVRGCGTSKDIWDTICRLKESTAAPNLHLAWQELHSIRWDGETPVAGYLGRVNEAVERLKSLKKEPDAACVMGLILSNLSAKFTSFKTTWNMTKLGADVKLLDLQSALLAAEADMNGSSLPASDMDTGALTAGRFKKGKKQTKTGKQQQQKGCFRCGEVGHYKADCPLNEDSSAGSRGSKTGPGKRRPGGSAMMAGTFGDGWLGDSGAYRHMTSHREWFSELLPAEETVTIGDGTPLVAKGIGKIPVETWNGRQWEPHTLVDVLLVPELKYSLFSVGAALKQGYELAGRKDRIAFLKNGVKCLIGVERDNLFDMGIRFAGRQDAGTACSAGSTGSLKLWHHRLGHVNEVTLKHMVTKAIVTGVEMPAEGTLGTCEGCIMGKMTHKPFKSTEWRGCSVGEIIHFDTMGPMPVESLGRKRYCLVFKDEATSIRRVFFLRDKSEALGCFNVFLKEIEEDFAGRRVKVIKSDNAKEFVSRQFNEFLEEKGIVRELSPPYSPQ